MTTPAPPAPQVNTDAVLDAEELRLIDAWWRACNYLSVGMIYLRGNPLLEEPLSPPLFPPSEVPVPTVMFDEPEDW